ncbi:MAG: TetR/AcrR family transcriptional regulator [Bacteroidota bacterium]|nr:TetR/AcrR family transcriptional regulator [Bacteroidota bacterium]
MSPRTPEQFEEMRESRRKQIMDAALELFASEGYSHCSISQLARHAGISKGLMYNYFESKEALLIAIIEEGMQDIMAMIDPNQDGILEPEEVEGFIRNTFKGIRDNMQFWMLFINVVLQPPVKEFLDGKPFSNVMERFGPRLLEYFERMDYEDPYLEMLTFSAMIEGYGILLVYLFPGDELPQETVRKFEDRMVDMFTRKKIKK